MLDVNLYDSNLYDERTVFASSQLYDDSDFGIDFGNGFKIPNNNMNSIVFKYLQPLGTSYSQTRKTQVELNAHTIQKTTGGITIQGTIKADTRAKLIEQVEYFKYNVRNKMNITIKDGGLTRIAKSVIETIEFDENHYNLTFIKFVINISFRDYLSVTNTTKLQYLGLTQAINNIDFYNQGLETDYVGILKINSGTNLNITLNFSGVELILAGLNTGDEIVLDTETPKIEKNGVKFVFGGILSKLIEKENSIIISDDGGARNIDFTIFYKKTIS